MFSCMAGIDPGFRVWGVAFSHKVGFAKVFQSFMRSLCRAYIKLRVGIIGY